MLLWWSESRISLELVTIIHIRADLRVRYCVAGWSHHYLYRMMIHALFRKGYMDKNIQQRKALVHVLDNVKLRRAFKKLRKGKAARLAVSAVFVGSILSGCVVANPEGFRVTASLGAEAIQEHEEKYTVKPSACKGLKGWLMGCADQQRGEVYK